MPEQLENLSAVDKLAICELLFGYYRGHAERSLSKAAESAIYEYEPLELMSKANLLDLAAEIIINASELEDRQ